MSSVSWQVAPSSLNLLASWSEGGLVEYTAFTPLYKPLVGQVGQLDRPNPEGAQYH